MYIRVADTSNIETIYARGNIVPSKKYPAIATVTATNSILQDARIEELEPFKFGCKDIASVNKFVINRAHPALHRLMPSVIKRAVVWK
jgi:hypothetical protein